MDVIGRARGDEIGSYFRNSIWMWHPLAAYCQRVAPEITSACRDWHTNDGDGLDGARASTLADALQAEIDSGRAAHFERRRNSEIEMLPNEACESCSSTGFRVRVSRGDPNDPNEGRLKCSRCNGDGYTRAWAANYGFSVANVQAFANFLRASGGFSIC